MLKQIYPCLLVALFSGIGLPLSSARRAAGADDKTPVNKKLALEDREKPDAPAVHVKVLRAEKLLGLHDNRVAKASIIEVALDPLASSPPHRHPGPVTGYVLEGTLEFQIGDQPLRTLRRGDTFFEPAMILHRVSRNPDKEKRCRVLVTMIHPADAKRLVIPEPVSEFRQKKNPAERAK